MKTLGNAALGLLATLAGLTAADTLPERLERENRWLAKVGETEHRLLWKRITVSGLYVDPRQPVPADGDILAPHYRKALMIHYGIGVSAQRFENMSRQALADAWPAPALEPIRPQLSRFYSWFEPVEAGDRYTLYWSPEHGLALELNGRETGRLCHPEAAAVIMSIWLGRAAISGEERDRLLAAWRGSSLDPSGDRARSDAGKGLQQARDDAPEP